MDQPNYIKKGPPADKSMDFDFLRKEAIRFAQDLSGSIWTDYNEHDPGVTLLEYLAYAITDLGYRTHFDLKDLLYSREDQKKIPPEYLLKDGSEAPVNAFFGPAAIFPNAPLTVADYRKLIIDRCKDQVKNAWFMPILDHEHGYKGLYRVVLQLTEDYNPENDFETHLEVSRLMAQNRNLCEDIEEIQVFKSEPVTVFAEINLLPDAFGENVLAEIIFELEEHLSPSIPSYRPDELREKGWNLEEIFEGPLPMYGFILDSDLKPPNPVVIVSQLRDLVAGIEGVRSVNDLFVRKKGVRVYGDEIKVDPDTYLVLSSKEMISPEAVPYPIRLVKEGETVPVNFSQVLRIYHTLAAKKRKKSLLPLDFEDKPPVSSKDLGEIRKYYSFQKLLPTVYGIGPSGLPEGAGRLRKARARQLKAYLLIFEQILANYLAQLAGLRHLFSLSDHADQTYFTQFPSDIPDIFSLEPFLTENGDHPAALSEQMLEKKLADWFNGAFDPGPARKNRFLDHLLARFGEIFTGDFLNLIFKEEILEGTLGQALIQSKRQFLQQYPELSRDRAKAFNYLENAWESDNISGLKRRVCLLLGIANPQNRFLAKSKTLTGMKWSGPAEKTAPNPGRLPFKTMLKLGRDPHRYLISQKEETWQLSFFKNPDPAASAGGTGSDVYVVYRGSSQQECESARDRLLSQLDQINVESEGFFLVEHLLLRPRKSDGFKLVLRLPDEEGGVPLVFRSLDFSTLPNLEPILNDLVFIGSIQHDETDTQRSGILESPNSNYHLLEDPELGGYYLLLLRKNTPVLIAGREKEGAQKKEFSIQLFKTKTEARSAIRLAMKKLGALKAAPSRIEELRDFDRELPSGQALVERNFYSHRLSLVLPAWPTHFQDPDFRSLFEQTVRMNVPVHLGVQFKWLEFNEMNLFENSFKNWLEARAEEMPNRSYLDELAIDLVRYLHPDQAIADKIATSHAASRSETIPHHIYFALYADPEVRYSFFLREDDLQIIDEATPESEGILKSAGITTWFQLSARKETDIRQLLSEGKFDLKNKDVKSWLQQAKAAATGQWRVLLQIQQNRLQAPETKAARGQKGLTRLEERTLEKLGARLENNNLTLFVGIDATIETWLRSAGIKTWKDLAQSKLADIRKITQKADPDGQNYDHSAWRYQADLAVKGQWNNLITYQGQLRKKG